MHIEIMFVQLVFFCSTPEMEVSWNMGTPKSSIYRWNFPLQTNHFGDLPFVETHMS